jgi:hypothetical protein
MTITLLTVLALETQVWEALKRGDPDLDQELLTPNFLGVYPTGFATREEHCSPLRNGPTAASYEILEPRLMELSPDLVLLTYLASWSRIKDGKPCTPEKMYISSIWQQGKTGWKNIFSQDTPAALSA